MVSEQCYQPAKLLTAHRLLKVSHDSPGALCDIPARTRLWHRILMMVQMQATQRNPGIQRTVKVILTSAAVLRLSAQKVNSLGLTEGLHTACAYL